MIWANLALSCNIISDLVNLGDSSSDSSASSSELSSSSDSSLDSSSESSDLTSELSSDSSFLISGSNKPISIKCSSSGCSWIILAKITFKISFTYSVSSFIWLIISVW